MTKRIKSYLKKKSFTKNVLVLVGGTAGAQLITVVASPIITRLYSPEDYGILASFTAVLLTISIFASLRYEQAIPLPKHDNIALAILHLSLATSLITTGIITLFTVSLISQLNSLLNIQNGSKILLLLPLGFILAGWHTIFNRWAIRKKAFLIISQTKIRQSLATLSIQLLGSQFGAVALVAGQASSQGVGVLFIAKRTLRNQISRLPSLKRIKLLAIRYKNFAIFDTWYAIFFSAGQYFPIIAFAAIFDSSAAGFYFLAHRTIAVPMTMISGAISSVFFSKAADLHREKKLHISLEEIQNRLTQVAATPALLIIITAPVFFPIIFGQHWHIAGELAQLITPWIFFQFISAPLTNTFIVLEKQRLGMIFQCIMLMTRVIAVMIGHQYGSLTIAVAAFSFGSSLCYIALILILIKITGASIAKVSRKFVLNLTHAILISSPAFLCLPFNSPIAIISGSIISTIIYAIYAKTLLVKKTDDAMNN